MKDTKDLFSQQSGDYSKFRPEYPPDFLEAIVSLSVQRTYAWDCGTGNGQVAAALSWYFEHVKATDISESQMKKAVDLDNVTYSKSRAEKTEFEPATFDLITVAQAIHWFDFAAFYQEVERVGRAQCILAVWGYGLLRIEPPIDLIIDDFYNNTVGDFWNKERRLIEDAYASLPFPFTEITLPTAYAIEKEFSPESLAGYIGTWSAVHNFRKNRGFDPIPKLLNELRSAWRPAERLKKAVFPIFTRIGKVHD